MKLGDLLVRAGLITEEQLFDALREQKRWGGRLGEILVDKGFCSEDVIVRAISKQLGVVRAEFESTVEFPPAVVGRLPYQTARGMNVAPYQFFEKERTLVVAMVDPRDEAKVDELAKRTGWKIIPAIATSGALIDARARIYRVKDELMLDAEDQELKFTDAQGRTLVRSVEELEREREARRAAKEAQARAEAARSQAEEAQARAQAMLDESEEILGFTDKKGRTLIRSIDEIRREARHRRETTQTGEAPQQAPSREELLATIEALQNEVNALKAVAVLLFKKGYITYDEYQQQMSNRAP